MRKQTVIVTLAAACLTTAGFFALPEASGSGRESAARDDIHDASFRINSKRHRNTEVSFQHRSEEISAMKQTTERDDSIRKLALDWSVKEPIAAEHWARNLKEEADRLQALNLICLSMGGRAPVDAIAMARRNDLGDPVIEAIVGRWAERDFTAASGWVTGSSTGNTRNTLLAKIALSRAETSPHEAASLVSLSIREGHTQDEAAMSVLHQWLRKDPQAAAEWINTFPDSSLKERAQKEIEGMKTYAGQLPAPHSPEIPPGSQAR